MDWNAIREALAPVAACAAGGVLAVFVSPGATKRENLLRVVAVVIVGHYAAPGLVELADSEASPNRRRLLFVGVGFASWLALSVLMALLESAAETAKKEGPFRVLQMIRGKQSATTVPVPPKVEEKDKLP